YSAKNNAFFEISKRSLYDDAGWDLSDAIEVDDDVFNEFTGTPPEGKERVAGDNGFPAWGDIPPLTHEQLVAAAETEKQSRIDQANDYMNGKQWPGKAAIGRLKGDELAQYN
ncbi:tail fiber assembly protein, partial [Citrobacter portucalensis]